MREVLPLVLGASEAQTLRERDLFYRVFASVHQRIVLVSERLELSHAGLRVSLHHGCHLVKGQLLLRLFGRAAVDVGCTVRDFLSHRE